MSDEPDISDGHSYWQGHWLNPVAFAEQWYEDHPESFSRFTEALEQEEKGRYSK